jgi:glycine hydroxymethyltransferase
VLVELEKISSQQYHEGIFNILKKHDRQVYEFIVKEYERQQSTLQLIAAENQCSRAALAALGSIVQNKTTEGFPGARYHGGCQIVDGIETLAVERAKKSFKAQYANVQPHSGTSANQIVLAAVLERGDKILSLGLDQGGHVSHGANVSFSGKFFDVENYYVDRSTFLLDYDAVGKRAREVGPKLIICGATAYSRTIDFKKFREIADSVGAFLLADISHIAGLVIAGAHPSPVDHAHFTTTSTYKPGGPRGGLILMGRDFDRKIKIAGKEKVLWRLVEKTTFPGVQGTPYLNNIAAKAIFFKETLSEEYSNRQFKIIKNAKRLANNLLDAGYDVLTGGTDNHMILINISRLRRNMTGLIAQKCLEDCGIIINMNRLPYDKNSISLTSGIRLGTPIVTRNGMGSQEMDRISVLIDAVLKSVNVLSKSEYEIKKSFSDNIKDKVRQLCSRFPVF